MNEDAWRRFTRAGSVNYPSAQRLRTYVERLFADVDLSGKRLLDVGGGGGMLSFYAALQGADVVCLEPTADGSNQLMSRAFNDYASALPEVDTVSLTRKPFQNFSPDQPFDVVVMHNSVNHLDEAACKALQSGGEAREVYEDQFRRLAAMTSPSGVAIISDCARRNLFGDLDVRNPFVPSIDWEVHQQPETWAQMLTDSGFSSIDIKWNPMTRTGALGRALLANPVGAYLTTSHFTIHAAR